MIDRIHAPAPGSGLPGVADLPLIGLDIGWSHCSLPFPFVPGRQVEALDMERAETGGGAKSPVAKTISVGEVQIRLLADDATFWRYADARYRDFYVSASVEPHEELELVAVGGEEAAGLACDGAKSEIVVRGEKLHMEVGNTVGLWDRRRHHGRICGRAGDPALENGALYYASEALLRAILAYHLMDRDSLLLHSAGIVRRGRGYLFVGRSGAGKSTVAELSAGSVEVLSDDANIASFPAGAEPTMSGTPCCGDFSPPGRNETAPLNALYFLRQAPTNRRTVLPRAEALRRLLQCVVFFEESVTATEVILDSATELCSRVPCYELEFVKNNSFWSVADV